jgi:hypothetical protein
VDHSEIDRRFNHHPPRDAATADAHADVRAECRRLADRLTAQLPGGREKALALTKLEELMFWANAAIARAPEIPPASQTAIEPTRLPIPSPVFDHVAMPVNHEAVVHVGYLGMDGTVYQKSDGIGDLRLYISVGRWKREAGGALVLEPWPGITGNPDA